MVEFKGREKCFKCNSVGQRMQRVNESVVETIELNCQIQIQQKSDSPLIYNVKHEIDDERKFE